MSIKDFIRAIFKIRVLENLIVKYNTGKVYGTGLTKFTPNHYSYNHPTWRVARRNGIKIKLDISNIVDWNVYFNFHEISRENLFSIPKNPSTIIDIGANIGEISLRFASKFPNAQIHSFEPHPLTFQRLSENINLNKFENLQVYNLGMGSSIGQVHFEDRELGNPGMNRVTQNPEKSSNMVDIITLDSFYRDYIISGEILIKIDVEGYEFEVLKGGKKFLEEQKPILFIELDDNNLKDQNSSALELIEFLSDLGYQMTRADLGYTIDQHLDLSNCHYDIICLVN